MPQMPEGCPTVMLAKITDGQLSVQNGAKMLGGAWLQMFRLLKRYRTEGTPAIRHRARGKGTDHKIHKIHKAKRDYALA